MIKEAVVCLSRLGSTEGGDMVPWCVFLRHTCPRSPTADPGPSTCASSLGAWALTAEQGCKGLVIQKLQAKTKICRESLCATGICQTSALEQQICSFPCAACPAHTVSCRKQRCTVSRLPAIIST